MKQNLIKNIGLNIQVFAGKGGIVDQINTTNQLISADISDELSLINPAVSPIVSHILRGGRKRTINSTVIEWTDTYIRKTDSTLKEQIDNSVTSLKLEDKEVMVKDSVLAIDDELILITNVSGDTATVTRGFGETTKAEHKQGAEVKSIGIFMEEGGELKSSTVRLPITVSNRTGIVYEEFEVTETAKHTYIQGQSGLSAYQMESMKKKEELMAIIENKLLNAVTFSTGKQRNNDGVKSLIKKHGIVVDAGGVDLTKDFLDKIIKKIIDAGGQGDLQAGKYFICVPYNQQNKIDNFNKDTIRTTQAETVTGVKITQIVTTGGVLNVFPASSLASTEALIINLDELEIDELYPIKEEIGAKTKLADKYFMHGEWTVKLTKCPLQMLIRNLKA